MVMIFLRLEKIQFGGVKGQPLSDLVEAMFQEFNDLMNAFTSKPEDPLDISNNVSICNHTETEVIGSGKSVS